MATIVESLASAIARQEGTGCRRNNPGNLRSWPGMPTSGGFAVFPTCDAGWAALREQIERNIRRGLTLEEFFAGRPGVYPGYAPAADSNRPDIYAANVAQWTGIPRGVPIINLDPMSRGGAGGGDGFQFYDPGDETGILVAAGLALAVWLWLS